MISGKVWPAGVIVLPFYGQLKDEQKYMVPSKVKNRKASSCSYDKNELPRKVDGKETRWKANLLKYAMESKPG